ncbi:MAG: SDR family NAD(P)-dependent oxidoreductase, partial [Bacteroidota bacterium]
KNIENPKAPINLIHLDDCIGIIERIIEQEFWGEILNGVTPFHPSREDYYQQKAAEKNLPLPEFDHQLLSRGKTISSSKVENILKYQFKVKSL